MIRSMIPERIRALSACVLATLGMAGSARADDGVPDPVAAALFREGRELVKAGKWDEGCPKLEASVKRYVSPSTLLNLALCREHSGLVATAWSMAERALVLNRDTESPSRREGLDAAGRELVARLEPRLPRLRVTLVSPVAGAHVTENGSDLPLDTTVPLDPGPHELRAAAPGHEETKRMITLREGETLAVEMTLQPNASAPVPGPAPAPTLPAGETTLPTWVWIVGGAGLVLGGFGVGFAVDAATVASELEERCGADLVCDEDLAFDPEPVNEHKNRSTALAVAFGAAGTAGIVAAVIGLATHEGDASAPVALAPLLGPGLVGLSAAGSF